MASDTCGVKPMSIQGRLVRERERLLGMTDEERAWRKQWLKDQHLSPNEPRFVPEAYYELNNPIRRLYRAPLDYLFKFTEPLLVSSVVVGCRVLYLLVLSTCAIGLCVNLLNGVVTSCISMNLGHSMY